MSAPKISKGCPGGTPPATLTFAGSAGPIVATFTGAAGQICTTNGCGGSGRFATSGTNYFDVSTNSFSVAFSTAVAAFGFYATDIGDFNGQLTITLIHATGPNTTLTVNNTLNGNDGSLLFWGVIDTANPFTSIQFGNTAPGTDFFGFDDIRVGDVRQVTGGVPEPTTWGHDDAGLRHDGLVAAPPPDRAGAFRLKRLRSSCNRRRPEQSGRRLLF